MERIVNSILLRGAAGFMVLLILPFSLVLVFQGHNYLGGGFIGGLIASGGCALYRMTYGKKALKKIWPVHFDTVLGVGLGILCTSGFISVFQNKPFLTGIWLTYRNTPIIGTPLLLDIGIYFTVIGSLLMIFSTLEEES